MRQSLPDYVATSRAKDKRRQKDKRAKRPGAAGLAGLILTAYSGAGYPRNGIGTELDAIAAVGGFTDVEFVQKSGAGFNVVAAVEAALANDP